MSKLKWLIALKLALALACGIAFYNATQASGNADGAGATGGAGGTGPGGLTEKAQTALLEADAVPRLPEGPISVSQAADLRAQLELLRRDVETKIARLAVSKKAYDRAREEVAAKLKRIEEEKTLLEETLQKEKKSKEERLTEALEFVAKMEPRKAAPIIEGMDRDLALHLFRKLPPRQVTKILESVSPKKATELMEYYTRIRSVREFDLMRELGLCQSTEKDSDEPKASSGNRTGQIEPPPSGAPPAASGAGGAATGPVAKSTVEPSGANPSAANQAR